MSLERVYTADLDRDVFLRPGTRDSQVWADTFTGRYHLPPESMPVPRTVLDLGANIGLTAAHYHALWPDAEIVAVEMDRDNAALASRNALVDERMTIVENAVSDEMGRAAYDPGAPADAFSIGAGAAIANCLTLPHIIEWRFDDGADFVKMDVEGMEWRLFERGETWAPLVRHLLVELHGEGGSDALVARAVAELEAAGFHAERHERHPQAVWAWR